MKQLLAHERFYYTVLHRSIAPDYCTDALNFFGNCILLRAATNLVESSCLIQYFGRLNVHVVLGYCFATHRVNCEYSSEVLDYHGFLPLFRSKTNDDVAWYAGRPCPRKWF